MIPKRHDVIFAFAGMTSCSCRPIYSTEHSPASAGMTPAPVPWHLDPFHEFPFTQIWLFYRPSHAHTAPLLPSQSG
jgi:hypothetical protein